MKEILGKLADQRRFIAGSWGTRRKPASRGPRSWRLSRWIPLNFVLFLGGSAAFGGADMKSPGSLIGALESTVEDFRSQLGISAEVFVSIVSANPRLVSVERHPERAGAFLLELESDFLATLDEEEIRAALAHELGHVWIFTNHPFLHTESLANRKALMLVSRESLERVYRKVWMHTNEAGDFSHFFGETAKADR